MVTFTQNVISEGGKKREGCPGTVRIICFEGYGAAWNIPAVANPSLPNLAYIWNIVDDVTHPFLSWQP